MEDDIIVRKITREDVIPLAQLYDRVWPENAGRHYSKTAWGVEAADFCGFCAERGGRLIGSRACFRANIFIGSKRITSVQFGDSGVDNEYRRYGLFSRMNKSFLDCFFRTGNELIYNISVDASRKAYEKNGWVYIESISNIYRIIHPFSFIFKVKGNIRRLSGNLIVDDAIIPDVDSVPSHLLELRESEMVKKELIHNRYDRDTLKWRLGTDSGIRLLLEKTGGAVFYKTGKLNCLHCCIIGEMFLENYSYRCFKKTIRALIATGDYDVISIAITHAHPLYRFFRRNGFILNPLKPYLNHGVRVESDKMKEICLDPKNWALSEIDIDTF